MELRGKLLLTLVCAVAAAGCGDSPPGRTYYQRNIEPILLQKCAGNTSGCHSTNEGDPYSFAAGNFDVTSFENVQKRRDILAPFGAYPHSLLLIKSVGAGLLKLEYNGMFKNIDVQHSGGGVLEVGSDAYFTLQNWVENGATANGLKPATPPQTGEGGCSSVVPPDFDNAKKTAAMNATGFTEFRATVQPIITRKGCNAGTCHGAPQSDFYITCGTDDTQLAFNFSQAHAFVNEPVDDSQILRVPLAATAGGRGHTGGDQFANVDDADYKAIRSWADMAKKLDFAMGNPQKQFFADNVQPILLQRGCSFQACHSPQAANDFKLRSGSVGFFSAVALEKNYELAKDEFLALEFPDVRRGRAVAKSILDVDDRITSVGGIAHRGGPVLETPGGQASDPALCPTPWTPASNAFCTIQEWLTRERAALAGQVTAMNNGNPVTIVYVQRATANAGRLEFDTFEGGAQLMAAATTFGAGNSINPVAGGTAIHDLCPGLGGTVDIGPPDVAFDGTRVTFAARASAGEPLGVFAVNIDGSGCVRVTPAVGDSNGLKVHNFDPAWSPDGSYIVFASTRGKAGATRGRKRLNSPQSDLWRIGMNGLSPVGAPEQMTFLSNSEINPQFMREGRVTMTTEKASDGFYQLSGRRINWDLTDYHPLLAQRAQSLYYDPTNLTTLSPALGFSSATDIREGSNGDFLLILSNLNAQGNNMSPGGGGALAIFNRSIGPFEKDRFDPGYIPSLRLVDGQLATGNGSAASFRHPVSLPDGTIMASFAQTGTNFRIVSVDPRFPFNRTQLITNGNINTDAVLAYKYPPRQLYDNRRQLVFGGDTGSEDPARAIVHMPDAPVVFTLLTGNLRRGRPVEAFRKAKYLAVYEELPCPTSGCTANTNGIFQMRTMLGRAELKGDGSARVSLPSGRGLVFELQDDKGNPIITMGEEHQLGPAERISMGVRASLFDAICGGCHGSITGKELDVAVTPDALTGASQSQSIGTPPASIGN